MHLYQLSYSKRVTLTRHRKSISTPRSKKFPERNRAFSYVFINRIHRRTAKSLLPILSSVSCRVPWTRIPKSSNIFHFLPSLYTMDAPFTKTLSLSRSSSSCSLSYVLPASPPSLTFASINKGRRSKRGAGSRLSSESLRVVLRFPLRSTPRRPRVSVHAILVVPRVCVYVHMRTSRRR